MLVIILTVACNAPLANLQLKFQKQLSEAQDKRLNAMSESLVNMKVLKLYAWEVHFKKIIDNLRQKEYTWIKAFQLRKAYNTLLFWSSPVIVSAATFLSCYFLGIPLEPSNVFTFVATVRLVQDPIRQIPDVISVVIQAKVAFTRISKVLRAPELQTENIRKGTMESVEKPIVIKSCNFSWDENLVRPTMRNVCLEVMSKEKVAICGKVGSGKSTLLAAILGEVPITDGTIQVCGKIAYVSQNAWIQTGTVQANILFGSAMDIERYQATLKLCSLVKDLEMLPFGDQTQIGERGINMSGGQKQRIQLARALYQDADIYLLDDPFSAVDAHTASSLFHEYVLGALSNKTVILVTHQVDLLPTFDSVLLMSDGEILHAAPFEELFASCMEFKDLIHAHKQTITPERLNMCFFVVMLGLVTSKSLFSQLLGSLFHAPMTFYDSTPLGRIISRVSSDLNTVDLRVPFWIVWGVTSSMNACGNLAVLAGVTWQVLFVAIPMIILAVQLKRYYLTSAKELMRINGTTKSTMVNHLSESMAGAVTIRAFGKEDHFFANHISLIDKNASPFLHNFGSTEWLILRIEIMSAAILTTSALLITMLPPGTFSSGFVGMALSYGLTLNTWLVVAINDQCTLSNVIISVERLNQYMNIESEAPLILKESQPPLDWPTAGRVELENLKIRYQPDLPLVLHGITCTFEGGHKIGIVGRTGSGKTTLISALFRLVEPAGGKIIIDGQDITKIGLHDLRSRLGIIPQDPILFHGSIRYNLDPLGQFTDQQIWEVLDRCQLKEAVEIKTHGLDSLVAQEGTNWSMGQRQLFCLGRALLRRSHLLVLDEATASIDNTTDAVLQKTIRNEFAGCTVITVAHRIPTVIDCNMVLAIDDGKSVEYDEPMKLMNTEGSLFRELVKEYWSHSSD
ncbi:hypothetical protein LUZ62_083285 [Rhynchospora pubera]|uniref:Uncharacterized protein n=1 Tax=Rhynchospora pubera TaxID=906938 RepID=A0AAV8C073_9POAL|nr:hypothetical protein LUZ62_083285 [Rhynchospora pubera]